MAINERELVLEQMNGRLKLPVLIDLLGVMIKRNAKLWARFRISFFTDIIGGLASISIFLFISKLVPQGTTTMNYSIFLVVGLIMIRLFDCSLNTPYSSLSDSYWMCRLESLLLAPVPLWVPMFADIVWSYIKVFFDIVLLTCLCILLGVAPGWPSNPIAFIGALILGTLGVLGMGLISASSFTLLNAKGWSDPFRWLISTFAGLISGVYFPTTLLPKLIQSLSVFLPQTLALDLGRTFIARSPQGLVATLGINSTFVFLATVSIVWFIAGVILFEYSIKKARRVGSLSRWT